MTWNLQRGAITALPILLSMLVLATGAAAQDGSTIAAEAAPAEDAVTTSGAERSAAPEDTSPPTEDSETAAAEPDSPLPPPPPPPKPQKPADELGSAAAYSAAVRLHLDQDPALATTYIAFWNGLRQAQQQAGTADAVPESHFAQLADTGLAVTRAVRARYPEGTGTYRLADTLAITLRTLAAAPVTSPPAPAADGAGKQEKAAPPAPESLLNNLDEAVAPRVMVNGRYEFAGNLHGPATLGFGADVWQRCTGSQACITAHDSLFGKAMGGVSLLASVAQRLEQDGELKAAPMVPALLAELAKRQGASERGIAAEAAPTGAPAQGGGTKVAAKAAPAGTSAAPSAAAPAELQAMLTLGQTSAYLLGADRLATSFNVLGPPALEVARLTSQGVLSTTFLGATAGIGLVFAGMQALSLFDGSGGPDTAPPELTRLITDLQDRTARQYTELKAQNLLASNALDTRLASLGVALAVVKDDVARIESGQRARVRADFMATNARRWTAFEADNERCFALRSRDPRTGLLRAADFRRCEDRLLQGAVRQSQYATRPIDYQLDARYLDPADLRYPFHHHYPLLLSLGGLEEKAALALPDPLEWQQYTAALLRLYQENPAQPGDYAQRAEVLRSLRAGGSRIHDALLGLVVSNPGPGPGGRAPAFRQALHEQVLARYLTSLDALIRRVGVLDDPDIDRYGKRLTAGLDQPLPTGRKRAAIEAVLSGAADGHAGLQACADGTDAQFATGGDDLQVEARRFFGEPITAGDLARHWNRETVAGFALEPEHYATLVPPAFLWAALDGLGRIDVCLTRFRAAPVALTREPAAKADHLLGRATVDAQVEVRFTPAAPVARALQLDGSRPVTVASYVAERRCTFGYRDDDKGCSRGACLAELAPAIWRGDGDNVSCADPPLAVQITPARDRLASGELLDLAAQLADPYWKGRSDRIARLEADILRSSEYQNAAADYLQYYALAAVTLGTYPDNGEPLAPLFAADGKLDPRSVVHALVRERMTPAGLRDALRSRRQAAQTRIADRGREVQGSVNRLPALQGLEAVLARVDLTLAGYQP